MNNFIYYVQLNNQKKGPLTIEEVKQLRVSPQTLVWRNDSPDWLPASSFSELTNSIIEPPPLLPKEKEKIQKTNKFEKSKKELFKYFLIASFSLGILSSIITIISYENWPGKGHESEFGPSTQLNYTLRYTDPSIGWSYNRNNESIYAEEQLFILRPLYPFFSTAYLSSAEQDNYILIFVKQIISSLLLLASVFLIILAVKYFQSQQESAT